MGPNLVVPLDDLGGVPDSSVGGKAASLVRMILMGLPVPPGFCVLSKAYREHLKDSGLWSAAVAIAAGSYPGAVRHALARLRDSIVASPMSVELAGEVNAAFVSLGAKHVAVRSSATAEDLPGHSFAGQHGTYFVADPDTCCDRVKQCWASLWSERAFAYREMNGFDHLGVHMAVVVQVLVVGEASGVVFTADPVSGREDRLVVESCFGMGEALVSGKVSPDRFVLAKDDLDLLERNVGTKDVEVSPDNGNIGQRGLARGRASLPSIDVDTAREVARLALLAERRFGAPQDVEWTVRKGEVYILQARPITALPSSIELVEPVPVRQVFGRDEVAEAAVDGHGRSVSLSGPDSSRLVWSNLNTGEVLPDVAPPLTWSITRGLIAQIFGQTFQILGVDVGDMPIVAQIAGRAYFCLTTFAALVKGLPAVGKLDLTEVFGGEQERFAASGAAELLAQQAPPRRASVVRLATKAPKVLAFVASHSPKKGLAAARRMREETLRRQHVDFAAMSEDDLAAQLAAITSSEDYSNIVTFALVGMIYFSNLFTVCRKWLGDADSSIANRLLSGMGDMESAQSGLALWRLAAAARTAGEAEGRATQAHPIEAAILAGGDWPRTRRRIADAQGGDAFLADWDAFMDRHGHHTRGEIDGMNPRWSEQPDYVLDTVRGYLESMDSMAEDPVETHRRRGAQREALTIECRRRLNPPRRAVFDFILVRAQTGCVVRENIKSEAIRRVSLIRRASVELGHRLAARGVVDEPGDIFFLFLDEIDPVRRAAVGDIRESVAARKAEHQFNLSITPPSVIVGRFDPEDFTADPVDASAKVMTGLAVSPGVVVGPAHVVLRSDTHERIRPGEILVAPFTDPGWTPYFMTAAGIVVDMGGLLSHGSIVAREYGIPAVVNVGPATKIVRTGQMIEVDGNGGQVKILD